MPISDLTTWFARKVEALRAAANSATADSTSILTVYLRSVQANTAPGIVSAPDINAKLRYEAEETD